MARRAVRRTVAGLNGLLLALLATWVSLLGLLAIGTAASVPDAFAPEGDPCCGPPGSWGDVAYLGAAGLLIVAIAAGLFAGALALGVWSVRHRRLRRSTLLRIPAAATALAAVVLAGFVLANLGDARMATPCSTFVLRPADWRSPDPDRRLRTAEAIGRCGVLEGKRPREVAAALGRPDERERSSDAGVSRYWRFAGIPDARRPERPSQTLIVAFSRGRVASAYLPGEL